MADPCDTQATEERLVYGRAPASDFLAFLGPIHGTVLDIGSGEGAWAGLLRRAGAARLVSIEPDPTTAAVARSRYDLVLGEPIEDVKAHEIARADLIVAADCLEHMTDPWAVLRYLRAAASDRARLAISVPNLQYLGILAPAMLRGRFDYSDSGGLMDRGHIRWFTRASMKKALEECGWAPTAWSGATGSGSRALINRMTKGALRDLLAHQIYVIAAPRPVS